MNELQPINLAAINMGCAVDQVNESMTYELSDLAWRFYNPGLACAVSALLCAWYAYRKVWRKAANVRAWKIGNGIFIE